jgi:hypothetical protein
MRRSEVIEHQYINQHLHQRTEYYEALEVTQSHRSGGPWATPFGTKPLRRSDLRADEFQIPPSS